MDYNTRKLELSINITNVLNYILKLEPELRIKSNKALKCLTFRFLQKDNFVLRKATHIGQTLPLYYENKIKIFLKDVIYKWKYSKIHNNNLYLLIKTDEAPVFFDAPFESTYDKKGKNDIKIKTSRYEKERIILILTFTTKGDKLTTFIIFKGVPEKK